MHVLLHIRRQTISLTLMHQALNTEGMMDTSREPAHQYADLLVRFGGEWCSVDSQQPIISIHNSRGRRARNDLLHQQWVWETSRDDKAKTSRRWSEYAAIHNLSCQWPLLWLWPLLSISG